MAVIYTKENSEVDVVVCDRCKAEVRELIDLGEVLHVRLNAGYGSKWGDGNNVAVDLCDACAVEVLSPFANVSPSDEVLRGKPALSLLSTHPKGVRPKSIPFPERDAAELLAVVGANEEADPWLHPIESAWRRAVARVAEKGRLDRPIIGAGRGGAGHRLIRDPQTWQWIEGPTDRWKDLFRYMFSYPKPYGRDVTPRVADALVWEYIESLVPKGPPYKGEGLEEWERKVLKRS